MVGLWLSQDQDLLELLLASVALMISQDPLFLMSDSKLPAHIDQNLPVLNFTPLKAVPGTAQLSVPL